MGYLLDSLHNRIFTTMICVGITGSYASGKSFVLNYLAGLGFATFSSDEYIRDLYKDPKIQNRVISLLTDLKVFNKIRIAELIYANESARITLQNFIHPFIVEALSIFKQQNIQSDIIFAEIPLLFEAGFDHYFDVCVTIFCSETTRLERAKSRESFSFANYNKIAQIQLPQQDKIEKADFVINSDVNLLDLHKQINQLIQKLTCITN